MFERVLIINPTVFWVGFFTACYAYERNAQQTRRFFIELD